MTNNLVKIFDSEVLDSSIAIAVSGGVDSLVLMNLANESKVIKNKDVFILTINHGLRTESIRECKFVENLAKKLGFKVKILRWEGIKPSKALQEKARNERYNLLLNFCRENSINNLFLAHHLDDQIENFLFRMFRGSGIKGLTSFSNRSERDGILLIRPLIDIPKSELIMFAKKRKIKWVEDPSNQNKKFERIKLRKILPLIYEEGFDKKVFLKSIKKLKLANKALNETTKEFVSKYVLVSKNISVFIDHKFFLEAPKEIQLRVIENSIRIFSGERFYSPSYSKMMNLINWISESSGVSAKTLGGTIFRRRNKGVILYKEVKKLNEIKPIKLSKNNYKSWDNRFLIKAKKGSNGEISYLGAEGVKILKSKKKLHKKDFNGIPITALYSTPAVWRGKRLISAPFFDYSNSNGFILEIKNIDYLL